MPRAPRLHLIDPAPCFPGTTGTVQRDPPLQTLCEFRRRTPCCLGRKLLRVHPATLLVLTGWRVTPIISACSICTHGEECPPRTADLQQADCSALRAHGQVKRGNTCSVEYADDPDPQVTASPSADVAEAPSAPLLCTRT